MINFIENQEQLFIAEEILEFLDSAINKTYSLLEKTIIPQEIIDLQNFIDIAKKKHLGFFGLIQIYKSKINTIPNLKTYEVRDGDTLVMISEAFYGESVFYQFLYYENELTTEELTVGQIINIPKLPKRPESVLFNGDIVVADAVNLAIGVENV